MIYNQHRMRQTPQSLPKNRQQRSSFDDAKSATKFDVTLLDEYVVRGIMHHVGQAQSRYVVSATDRAQGKTPSNSHVISQQTLLDNIGIY